MALVQGLTEFLPISSSAHLILVPELLGWEANGLAFDVAVHVGTLLAVVLFLKKELMQIIPAWFGGWQSQEWNRDGLLGWMIIVATIPVGLIGLYAGQLIEQFLRTPLIIAAATLIFGLLLGWADRKGDRNQGELTDLNFRHALMIGGAQALALIPGTSRSGVTMTALLAFGYSRIAAARFSFLLAIPAIALPGLLKTVELSGSAVAVPWTSLLVGVLVSAVVALLCMHWFIRFIQRVGMLPFVIYRVLLAVAIVIFLV